MRLNPTSQLQPRRFCRGKTGGSAAASVFALAWALVAGALAESPTLTLGWDPNSEPDLAGYRLHYGLQSGSYTVTRDLGMATTADVSSLTAGSTYYFAVTSYNIAGLQSLPSDEIAFTMPGAPPAPPPPPPATSLLIYSVPSAKVGRLGNLPTGSAIVIDLVPFAGGSYRSFYIKTMPGSSVTISESSDLEFWRVLREVPNPTGIMLVYVEVIGAESRFFRAELDLTRSSPARKSYHRP